MAKPATVFNFLYIDENFIDRFLGQIFIDGVLQEIVEIRGREKSDSGEVSSTLGGGVVPAQIDGKLNSDKKLIEQAEKRFDARHTRPSVFIEAVTKRNLVAKKKSDWKIGGLLELAGVKLSVVDIGAMNGMWNAIASMSKVDLPEGLDIEKLIDNQSLPIISRFQGGGGKFFAPIEKENLLVSHSNTSLMHGTKISGTWNVLGLLETKDEARETSPQTTNNQIFDGIGALSQTMMENFGRQKNEFGIRPVLIYRSF